MKNRADFKALPSVSESGSYNPYSPGHDCTFSGGKKGPKLYQQEDVRSSLKIRGWESGWPTKKDKAYSYELVDSKWLSLSAQLLCSQHTTHVPLLLSSTSLQHELQNLSFHLPYEKAG